MKVYVMTKAKPFEEEVYIGVASSVKAATKRLRGMYPHMRPSEGSNMSFISDGYENPLLLFIHEEEVI